MVQRRPDDPRLVVEHPLAFLALQPDHVGDVGLQDHRAAVHGALFADLQPAVADQCDVEHHMVIAVPGQPAVDPLLGRLAPRQEHVLAAAGAGHILAEGQPRLQRPAHVGQVAGETAVEHHQPFLGVEQREAFLDRLDGIGQVAARALGLAVGLGKAQVRLVQQVEGLFQIAGAGADLFLEQHGALEMGVPRAAIIPGLLDPRHQRLGDLPQLVALAFDRVVRVNERLRHGPSWCRADRSPRRSGSGSHGAS